MLWAIINVQSNSFSMPNRPIRPLSPLGASVVNAVVINEFGMVENLFYAEIWLKNFALGKNFAVHQFQHVTSADSAVVAVGYVEGFRRCHG